MLGMTSETISWRFYFAFPFVAILFRLPFRGDSILPFLSWLLRQFLSQFRHSPRDDRIVFSSRTIHKNEIRKRYLHGTHALAHASHCAFRKQDRTLPFPFLLRTIPTELPAVGFAVPPSLPSDLS